MQVNQRFIAPSRLPRREQRSVTATEALDSVQLSASSRVFEPAAHLHRAANEFLSLVPTHPTERDEFLEGAGEIQKIVAEVLYGGRWPEAQEMPNLSAPPKPGEPAQNGGLSRSEQLVSNDLIELYRKTSPSVSTPQQHKRLARAIHLCQSGLQSRVLRRDYPNYWMSSPGSLQKDAEREAARWG